MEEQKRLAGKLAALHHHLDSETIRLKETQEENKQTLETMKLEQQQINLEERSNTYWQRNDELAWAVTRLTAAEKRSRENEEKLEALKFSGKVMQAAGIRDEIKAKQVELAGLNEKLDVSRSQYNTDERMRNLEYTLRKLTQELSQTLESALLHLNQEKADRKSALEQVKQDSGNLERELRNYEGEKGRLEQQRSQFEAKEREVRAKLKLNLNRNLLGELAESDIAQTRAKFKKTWDDLQLEGQKLREEKAGLEQRQLEAAQEIQIKRELQLNEKNILQSLEKKIADYEGQEEEIQRILQKYGFDLELRFDKERLHTSFNQLLKHLARSLEDAVRMRDASAESLFSLKHGRLHVPEELIAVLADKDIPYETGEAYLRNQTPELRQRLLEGNPVLPYALILPQEAIELLVASIQNLTLRRAIPVIAYEDLSVHLATKMDHLIQTEAAISLVCLYEGRVFDNDGLIKLEEELRQKQAEAEEQYQHYTGERNDVIAKQTICGRFDYKADHRYLLGKKKAASETTIQTLDQELKGLTQETENLRQTQEELGPKITANSESQQKAQAAWEMFDAWIGQEKDYQACRRRLSEVSEGILGAEGRKSGLAQRQRGLEQEIQRLFLEIENKKTESKAIDRKLLLYKEAPEGEIVPGILEELEERLQSLKREYSGEIELLEKRRKDLLSEGRKKEKELAKLGLSADDFSNIAYSEEKLDAINSEVTELETLRTKLQKETLEATRIESAAREARQIAGEEVQKLGAEVPLSPEAIKGNFRERLQELALRQTHSEQENSRLFRKMNDYNKLVDQITSYIKDLTIEPEKDFRPEQDVKAQTEGLGEGYRTVENQTRAQADTLKNNYTGLKANYRERNQNISNIFKGLDQLWDKARMTFDDFYYLYERMSLHKEKLKELIKLHETQLSNLERNKKDMVQQSLLQAMRFYEEIEWISDRSKVRLQGRSRPVQMLKVELSLDSNEAAGTRMKDYIEECIAKVREETRQEKSEDEVKKSIAKLMYSRELLNVYLNTSHIPVKVFKIDLNMQNSGLKTWEDAMRENSGGEKFVVYFSVLSALMAYTRSRTLEAAGAEEDKDSSVLVMDNPFGPISSEHLLNPLFEIASKHRTQLICLSDLKQNSILNCFNLIFMLKIRPSSIGTNEYLKFEEIIRDESAVYHDEKLEKAIFRVTETKQLNLFE